MDSKLSCFIVGLMGTSCSIISKSPDVLKFLPYEGIVKGYVHDAALPFASYFYVRAMFKNFLGCWAYAMDAFLVGAASEIAQGVGLYQGTYDPNDFVAYATGALLAVAVDKATDPRRSLDSIVKESS